MSSKLEPYTKLIGKHKGETAFIVGSGTSIHGLDLSLIHDHIVMTANAGILLMPWESGDPDKRYWTSNDALCRRWNWWPKVKQSHCIKVVRDSWSAYYREIPDFLEFSPRPTPEDVVNPEDEGLAYCSSIPSSLDLALQMGCSRIFLLGVDQYFRGRHSHFWQLWPRAKQPRRIDSRMASHNEQKYAFSYNNKAYPALKSFADHLGAEVYNCNPHSSVDCYQKISYNDALEMI